MAIFRPAQEADLRPMYEVWYQNEVRDSLHPPLPGDIPSYLHHVLETGTMYVAEQDREVLAFAGAITRGTITFLTDLFVRPAHQSGQLGKTLLHAVLPQNDLVPLYGGFERSACAFSLYPSRNEATMASFCATTKKAYV